MSSIQDSLDAMAIVMREVTAASAEQARTTLNGVLTGVRSREDVDSLKVRVIAHYHLAKIYTLLKLPRDARRNREEADSLLERVSVPGTDLELEDALAGQLTDQGKFKQALPSCFAAIRLAGLGADRQMALRLWRAGRCSSQTGLHSQADELLSKALEIARREDWDHLIRVALYNLGLALRRNNPQRAGECFQEAADLWLAEGRSDAAADCWLGLGLVCADSGRHQEALDWYEKCLVERQSSTPSKPVSVGLVYNNRANVYRRMGDFERAHQEIGRALELLESSGSAALSSAYGTRGLIFRDQGAHEEALPWLQKARAEYEKQPNLDLANLAEKLENEIGALRQSGRDAEALAAEEKLTRIRQTAAAQTLPDLSKLKEIPDSPDGAVLIDLHNQNLSPAVYQKYDVSTLEDRLEAALRREAVGELDGNEFGPEGVTIFLYGPDAEALFRAIEPVLAAYPLCVNARVRIRQGEVERELVIRPATDPDVQ